MVTSHVLTKSRRLTSRTVHIFGSGTRISRGSGTRWFGSRAAMRIDAPPGRHSRDPWRGNSVASSPPLRTRSGRRCGRTRCAMANPEPAGRSPDQPATLRLDRIFLQPFRKDRRRPRSGRACTGRCIAANAPKADHGASSGREARRQSAHDIALSPGGTGRELEGVLAVPERSDKRLRGRGHRVCATAALGL